MIVYICRDQSWSTKVRAAAIGRHLDMVVLTHSATNQPLDHFGVPYEQMSLAQMRDAARGASVIVHDMPLRGPIRNLDIPTVAIRPPGLWPITGTVTIDLTDTPIFSHDADELPTRGEVRVGYKGPLTLDLIDGPRVYPALPLMVGADLVRSYAGSMLCAETHAVGVPHLAIAKPGIPDQQDRANDPGPAQVLDRGDDWRPTYTNHARDVAGRIAALAAGAP